MSHFAEEVVVEPAGEGRYRAELSHDWDLFPVPQGGVVASFALRAAAREVDREDQPLRTCTTVFAGQVTAGPLEIETTILRRGRSASQTVATVRNAGVAAGATAIAVFGASRAGPDVLDVRPPAVPSPSDCRSYRESPPPGIDPFPPAPFWTRVEGRAALGHDPWEEYEPDTSDVGTWLRFDDPPVGPDGVLDPLGVVTLADRMPGSVREILGPRTEPWFAPSADLTVHLLEPLTTEWLLAHDRARWARDGWASIESLLWDEAGHLVGFATQMTIFTGQPSAGSAPGR